MVTVVIPVYDEQESLAALIDEIGAAFGDTPFEVVAVDDGSTDGSWKLLEQISAIYPWLRAVRLEQNAGQSAALVAGYEAARGDVVVTLDADGQNDPADAIPLVLRLRSDPELAAVVGVRRGRRDSSWKRMQSLIANRIRDWITGDSVQDTGCGLKVIRRAALLALPRFDGMHRFLPTLLRMQGARVAEADVSHRSRRFGHSKYGMWNRAVRGFRDALGVRWLSRRPLRYTVSDRSDSES